MKRKIFGIVCILIAAVTLSSCGYSSSDSDVSVPDVVLGEELSNELNTPCSDEDRAELQPILDNVEKAFSSVYSSREEAKAEWGEYLCGFTQVNPQTVKEEHNIEFLTGKIDGDSAYMWFGYWKKEYDSDGELTLAVGSEEEPLKTRLTAEKQNGEWVVTGVVSYDNDLFGE